MIPPILPIGTLFFFKWEAIDTYNLATFRILSYNQNNIHKEYSFEEITASDKGIKTTNFIHSKNELLRVLSNPLNKYKVAEFPQQFPLNCICKEEIWNTRG